jgi:hypothetical protein
MISQCHLCSYQRREYRYSQQSLGHSLASLIVFMLKYGYRLGWMFLRNLWSFEKQIVRISTGEGLVQSVTIKH